MPCAFAFSRTALPEPESRLTIMRTLTPLVIIWSAMVWNWVLSPWAFCTSESTPAVLNASSRYLRSAVSQRAEDFVSGRMTPIFGVFVFPPSVSPPPPPPLFPQPASSRAEAEKTAAATMELLRMSRPFLTRHHCVRPSRSHPTMGVRTMLRATTYWRSERRHNVIGSRVWGRNDHDHVTEVPISGHLSMSDRATNPEPVVPDSPAAPPGWVNGSGHDREAS